MAFFSFSIPKAIQRAADGGRSRRPYHVYEIRITPSGVSGSTAGNESWCVYRRYNEFYRLHRRLQKQYPTVKKLDFPPKKKFGNLVRDWAGRVAGSSRTSPLCLVVRARNRNYPSPESIPIPIDFGIEISSRISICRQKVHIAVYFTLSGRTVRLL